MGTIHYLVDAKKNKAACGMVHSKMASTTDKSKVSCPQCMAMYPRVGYGKGQARSTKPKMT